MTVDIVTKEDLQVLRLQLISDITQIIQGIPSPPDQSTWLKSKDVMKILNIAYSTLQVFRYNGTVKSTKIGGRIYYDSEHIRTLIKNKT